MSFKWHKWTLEIRSPCHSPRFPGEETEAHGVRSLVPPVPQQAGPWDRPRGLLPLLARFYLLCYAVSQMRAAPSCARLAHDLVYKIRCGRLLAAYPTASLLLTTHPPPQGTADRCRPRRWGCAPGRWQRRGGWFVGPISWTGEAALAHPLLGPAAPAPGATRRT